jgi:Fic-DOC domain mobile mystery protein B
VTTAGPDGATPLNPDEAEGLIPAHITSRRELNEWEGRNIQRAMVWALTRKRTSILNTRFTQELHRRMFDETWTWAGQFRRSDKNIGVAWEQILVQLHRLLEDVGYWIRNSTWSPPESAVRLHHRMVQIHPFVNGNGRHARLMADVLLFNHDLPRIEWGGPGLDAAGDMRRSYLDALRAADRGDFGPLLDYTGVSKSD